MIGRHTGVLLEFAVIEDEQGGQVGEGRQEKHDNKDRTDPGSEQV